MSPPISMSHLPIFFKKSADYQRFFYLCLSLEIGEKNRLVGIRLNCKLGISWIFLNIQAANTGKLLPENPTYHADSRTF